VVQLARNIAASAVSANCFFMMVPVYWLSPESYRKNKSKCGSNAIVDAIVQRRRRVSRPPRDASCQRPPNSVPTRSISKRAAAAENCRQGPERKRIRQSSKPVLLVGQNGQIAMSEVEENGDSYRISSGLDCLARSAVPGLPH
jgi:hypothetical protein